MARLERWIVASRTVPAVDADTMNEILRLGGVPGGASCDVTQHIHITAENKEVIEELLRDRGYTVTAASEKRAPGESGRFRISGSGRYVKQDESGDMLADVDIGDPPE